VNSREGRDRGAKRICWDDIDWIREMWKGPLVIKGLVTPEDALRSIDHGANGIVVSNHGGRVLDGLPATLRALPAIRAAVGDRVEVLVDSGIRRGSDVVKALALGADCTLVGRAYVYGLAAAGQSGVTRSLEILRTGILATMGALGCESVNALGPEALDLSRFVPVGPAA
jgi:isopentenyl diphosphate isomerase/L-lactate dehydrogenase-like FMN-dependent dehydrogenase